jgi:hypothetical protein
LIVDGSGNGYLRTVCDYVHLNPVRARLLTGAQPLRDYQWSSYPAYLQPPSKRPGWLRVDRLLGEWAVNRDAAAGRRQFAEAMEHRREQDEPGEWQAVRRGWFLGAAELKEKLLEQMGRDVGEHHGGEEKQETDAQIAERIVVAELRQRRWSETDLKQRRKTDALKVQIAARLRRETVQTLDWIARRLEMGCRHTLANCLKIDQFNQ